MEGHEEKIRATIVKLREGLDEKLNNQKNVFCSTYMGLAGHISLLYFIGRGGKTDIEEWYSKKS